ncbi:hypothetical protein QRB38_13140 [Mycobacterium avium subsp. hominissuis]|uniref:hypothetical protein n=1 Tax=Mycobacterium avium TaxID=1764 RepID=UPI0007A04E18|nr:hypothetical protein [Mycobacterium avium]MDO2394755.1 hypothetical protein [Mycobacterium avium subsp. hominissuis]
MQITHDEDTMLVTIPGGAEVLVSAFLSEVDGVPVIQVDTNAASGRLRVNLNDSTLWDGDPDTDGPVDD